MVFLDFTVLKSFECYFLSFVGCKNVIGGKLINLLDLKHTSFLIFNFLYKILKKVSGDISNSDAGVLIIGIGNLVISMILTK